MSVSPTQQLQGLEGLPPTLQTPALGQCCDASIIFRKGTLLYCLASHSFPQSTPSNCEGKDSCLEPLEVGETQPSVPGP